MRLKSSRWFCSCPAPHRVSQTLCGAREPQKSPKKVGKSTAGQGPKSAERVRPGVSKESEKSGFWLLSDTFKTPGRTLSAPLRPSMPQGTLSGLFLDSSGVPEPHTGPGRPCVAGPITTLVLEASRQSMLNFRIWFPSSIGGRLP